jgi:serine protease Do
LAAGLLAACRTLPGAPPTDTHPAPQTVSRALYTPLYDRDDHLADLIAAGDLDRADRLYREQQSYFDNPQQARSRQLVAELARRLNARHAPDLLAAQADIKALPRALPSEAWAQAREALARAGQALQDYPATGVLRAPPHRSSEYRSLREARDRLHAALTAAAEAAFEAFDHTEGRAFADFYPVPVDTAALLRRTWPAIARRLSQWDAATLVRFAKTYEKPLTEAGRAAEVGGWFARRVARDNGIGDRKDPLTRLALAAAAKQAGLDVPGTAIEIALVEATSPTLLRHGQIDFPVGIDIDLPVRTSRSSLEAAFGPKSDGPRLVLVLEVALAKASRRVTGLRQVPSILFLPSGGLIEFDNETQNADQIRDSLVPAQAGVSPAGDIPGYPAVGTAANADPMFYQYRYERARIVARKAMTVNYYLVDRAAGTYVKSTFDVAEQERFDVAYNIARADTRYRRVVETSDREADVDDFEKASSGVELSRILVHYLSRAAEPRKWRSLEAFYAELSRDRSAAVAAYKKRDFAARPLNDPRFDSVVAVYTGPGALGAGFYVQSDVVLTNWHVVSNRRIVEMRKYDGTETFGKVLGSDVRLDLALIRVQTRGRPVDFPRTAKLDLGAAVEAIGHPYRNEFTISRGVISAIREEYSINLPKRAGDKVLYVQTDSAINPGNSGGPLFLGDEVVGVNTWGYTPDVANNLNFAVHFGEVLEFLNEHLPGFDTGRGRTP